jgi:hypothetical protein
MANEETCISSILQNQERIQVKLGTDTHIDWVNFPLEQSGKFKAAWYETMKRVSLLNLFLLLSNQRDVVAILMSVASSSIPIRDPWDI